MKKRLLALAAVVVGFFIGKWAGGIDWDEWLRQQESGRTTQIGNQRAYEKVSLIQAWNEQEENENAGLMEGYRACKDGRSLDDLFHQRYPDPKEALHAAKRMAGYE